jgi:hypothetical protein
MKKTKQKGKGENMMSTVLSINEYKETIGYQKKNNIKKDPPAKKYSDQEINDIIDLESNSSSIEDFHKKWDK